MDNSYIKLLYKDLSKKAETINKYVTAINNQTKISEGDISKSIKKLIGLLNAKLELIESFQKSRKPSVSTNFATEPLSSENVEQDNPHATSRNIIEVDTLIDETNGIINHLFDKVITNVDILSTAISNYQESVKTIYDTFDGKFKENK